MQLRTHSRHPTDSRFRSEASNLAYTDVLLDEHERGRRDHHGPLVALAGAGIRPSFQGRSGRRGSGEIVIESGARRLAERAHIQEWEREEIRRSVIESAYTAKSLVRYSDRDIDRFLHASPDTIYPLEYSHSLLGDVSGKTVLDFGCGAGKSSVC